MKKIEIRINIADSLFAEKKYAKALESCVQGIMEFNSMDQGQQDNSQAFKLYVKQGTALRYLNRDQEAAFSFEEAIKFSSSDAGNAMARANKGFALEACSQYSKAAESFSEAIKYGIKDARVYHSHSKCLVKLNRDDEALIWVNKFLESNPTNTSAHLDKFIILGKLQKHEDALKQCQDAIDMGADATIMQELKNDLKAALDSQLKSDAAHNTKAASSATRADASCDIIGPRDAIKLTKEIFNNAKEPLRSQILQGADDAAADYELRLQRGEDVTPMRMEVSQEVMETFQKMLGNLSAATTSDDA